MRTYLLIFVGIFLLAFSSCNTKVKKENEALKEALAQLEAENEALKKEGRVMANTVEDFRSLLNEVDANLEEIDENRMLIAQLGQEGDSDEELEERMRTRVSNIVQLMQNTKLKMLALERNLASLRKQSGEQSEEILALEAELNDKVELLMSRDEEITQIVEAYEELEEAYQEQLLISNELESILNQAYFVAGTPQELQDKGIVKKEGGFIGIGKVKVLNADRPLGQFNEIQKDMTDTLVFSGTKPMIITQHPEGSFALVERESESMIRILDKEAFWNEGNYLVVQVKK